jgi:hypothetical protein
VKQTIKTLHHEKYIMIAAVLFTGIFAQNTKPQLEAVGNQVKATYHEMVKYNNKVTT